MKVGAPVFSLIELRLHSLEQLFDPFDPFPIPTRDLARGAEDYIVGWAQELPGDAALAMRIYLPDSSATSVDVEGLRAAVAGHFLYRARRTRGDMHELLTIAQVSLGIGLGVLAVCIVLRQLLQGLVPGGAIVGFLGEGLVIVGWVANWRPIEILLYEWWPLARRRRLLERLANAPVDLAVSGPANPAALDPCQAAPRNAA
ncbi:MAG: hypothetical protein ABL956_05640 [Hyphomonadaceae bacterium]